MRPLREILTDRTAISLVGVILLSAVILIAAYVLQLSPWAALGVVAVILGLWLAVWWWRRRRAAKAADALGSMLNQESDRAVERAAPARRTEIEALRRRMGEAIGTIKSSKLGQFSGREALYELPWYVVIGNPAAGKSSAIVNSGLTFPFSDQSGNIIQGIGGTRNCDWFFTTEGILLDTAGRYSVHDEDRAEWLGFLKLLKRHRPKAPINGIVVGASVAELTRNKPEYAIGLAKQVRQRVQEITSELEVFAPVYVVFTKVDLIAGFVEFFGDADKVERERTWGATFEYDTDGRADPVSRFDEHFEQLYEGVKEMSVSRMAMYRGEQLGAGVLAFPLEFAAMQPVLRSFVATLFEDNPFQFKPIFRGFYFTSALQEGETFSASGSRIADRFGLKLTEGPKTNALSSGGFFLKDLFSRVVFADRNLVRQYVSPTKRRLRVAAFAGAVAVLGLALGAFGWSYVANARLVAGVEADLDKAVRLQADRVDLASRLEAMEVLQDRIEQLERFRDDKPLSLGFGLYQGDRLEAKLRAEYFAGVRQLLLDPVKDGLELFLADVNAHAAELKPVPAGPAAAAPVRTAADAASGASPYREVSPTNVEDAYNGLKTYLMLADHEHLDVGHLNDQATRFWRVWLENNRGAMPREQMIRSAERMLTFALARADGADFPVIADKLTLVDQTRDNLRRVMRGVPARERVYAEIKARASTRFPAMTVVRIVGDDAKEILAGSYAVPGTFTRDAWEQYVSKAIDEAANKELQSTDWVLKTSARDDLTLEGSPEQIQKALVQAYKSEYVKEWQSFLKGVTVPEFGDFDIAVKRMNQLGDPVNSPLQKLMNTVYQETSWDNPSLVGQGLQAARRGVIQWFRETILRQAPARVNINVAGGTAEAEVPMGPIGKEFAPIARMMVARGSADGDSLWKGYIAQLSKARARFNQMKTAGDPGPAAVKLMQQTLEGNGSELADALRFVDEQMLSGMSDSAKAAVRPLLVRPLMMAFAVVVKPAEAELNRTWTAQVYEPYSRSLADKYPFNPSASIEAAATEIGQTFGTDGSVAKFVQTSLGPLVVRRGDTLTPRTWADMGVSLDGDFAANFPRYVQALGGAGAAGGAAAGAPGQTQFQIRPLPTAGLTEYTVDIDGQRVRYRMGQQQWFNLTWPNPQGQPGARISAVTYDGRQVEVANQPGHFGLERLINSATRKRNGDGSFALAWSAGGATVRVDLRIISSPQVVRDTSGAASSRQGLMGAKLPAAVVGSRP